MLTVYSRSLDHVISCITINIHFFYSTYIIRFCHVFVSNDQGRRLYNRLETLFRGYPQGHGKCPVNEVWVGVC